MTSVRFVFTLMLAAGLTGCGQRVSRPAAASLFEIAIAADGAVAVAAPGKLWPPAPADWNNVFTLRVIGADGKPAVTPLLGAHSFAAGKLTFRPQFPLSPGQEYEAKFDPGVWLPSGGVQQFQLTKRFRLDAAPAGSRARIEAIYPSTAELPANHFKFYILFSEPMWQRGFFKYLKLIDEKGAEVPEPFRETELWSEDGRRLTLWFHPGRQKTGVNLNVEIGPILRPGGKYTLEISGDWPVQSGGTLGETYRKKFSATDADHAQPDINSWKITPPVAGAIAPLRVRFPEPLDWALLHSRVRVLQSESPVQGTIQTLKNETMWQFTPSQPWQAGAHHLAVGAVLEDLAGNSLERPFEINLNAAPVAGSAAERFINFTIK